jgi:prepilin-type N-terminal cleavage/methylation domain-containing protein
MTHAIPSKRTSRGFSLLEVLIAVVLLATGLLALAALQGSLARNSADAKTRSRIVSLLQADIDLVRTSAYATLPNATFNAASVNCATTAVPFEIAACNASTDAGVGNLVVTRTITQYGANAGGTGFVAGAPAAGQKAEFKSVLVTATWTDATGQPRSVSMNSAISALALDVNNPLVDNNSNNNPPKNPVVRQANPETAGMIPIALGTGESTAASNPTPEQVGQQTGGAIIGTRFNVLTYKPEGNNLAVIQDRVETEVIKCTCQYGAGGNNLGEIYRASQWPAVWTGTRYDVFIPDAGGTPPGQAYASGPKSGVAQSALCQECCRDHHDNPANTTNAKFDPETTATTYKKYYLSGGTLTEQTNTTSGTYIDACRIIRVNGMWRTAADMYQRQFALLETQSDNGTPPKQAKSGIPTPTVVTSYTTFVKDYLKQYDGSVATAPTNATTLFDDTARGLNNPATISIELPQTVDPTNPDYRYLHSRGLFVDYLEKQARDTLAQSLAKRRAKGECGATSTGLPDCVLPFLPFTTINLTEISTWARTDANILNINTSNLLDYAKNFPSGGRTEGKAAGTASVTSTLRVSNSGVAVSDALPGPVDAANDGATMTDAQPFTVTAPTTPTTDHFYAIVNGGGSLISLKPATPSGAATYGECFAPTGNQNARECMTEKKLPGSASLTLSKYYIDEDVSVRVSSFIGSIKCMYGTTPVDVEQGNNDKFNRPYYTNYQVTAVNPSSGTASYGTPSNDGKSTETTVVTMTNMTSGGSVTITLGAQSAAVPATLASCTATVTKQGKYYMETANWTKSWVP